MYRGENIEMSIKGDALCNLDEFDFKVLVYPDRHIDEAKCIEKADCVKLETNQYKAVIGFADTKEMPVGSYTIEILTIEGDNSRGVYSKAGAFSVYDSASKNID